MIYLETRVSRESVFLIVHYLTEQLISSQCPAGMVADTLSADIVKALKRVNDCPRELESAPIFCYSSDMNLFIVATPIGNLEDISARALAILRSVGVVFAEDTRVTAKLLTRYDIRVPVHRSDENSSAAEIEKLLDRLATVESAALTTDAGTPNLSDPAFRIIAAALARFGTKIKIIPIPGPSALLAAISIAHFPPHPFVFLGFPPAKKGRSGFFDEITELSYALVLFESVHRINKTLEELARRAGSRECLVARELTKMHEQVWRGTLAEVVPQVAAGTQKGEYVILIAPKEWLRKS